MVANGTKFLLWMGEADWTCRRDLDPVHPDQVLTPDQATLEWSHDSQALILRRQLSIHVASPRDTSVALTARRGADRDRFGNCYWISSDERSIQVRSAGDGLVTRFWPPVEEKDATSTSDGAFHPSLDTVAPPAPVMRGLVVCEGGFLLAGLPETGQLLVFDLWGGGSPTTWNWGDNPTLRPWDMAALAAGGAWILDRDQKRLWALTRHWFIPAVGGPPTPAAPADTSGSFHDADAPSATMPEEGPPPAWIPWDLSQVLSPDQDPIAVARLADNAALVLWRDEKHRDSGVCRFGLDGTHSSPVSLSVALRTIVPSSAAGTPFLAHDLAVQPPQPHQTQHRLFVMEQQGNQAFEFEFEPTNGNCTAVPTFWPTRSFTGKGLVNGPDTPSYDSGEIWYPLVPLPRPRHSPRGLCETPPPGVPGAFDSQRIDCVWHRVLLDLHLPPSTAVRLSSRAGNSPEQVAAAAWTDEPTPYRRGDGGELPYLAERVPGCHQGTWEVLLQRARGRYLQLRIELVGDQRSSPQVHALRVYAPRFSYLERYLPALYSADASSASFLERFLANLEGLSTTLEDQVANVELLFDCRSTPREFLDWLAGWLGVVLDPAWDESRRRLFLRHAHRFFLCRGTIRGLVWALRLALDDCLDPGLFENDLSADQPGAIRIVEHHRLRHWATGDPTAPLWRPDRGIFELHQLYRAFLGEGAQPDDRFSLTPPAPRQTVWREFCRQVLGFVPAQGPRELTGWRQFLQRRHGTIETLNAAWNAQFSSFREIPLDDTLLDAPAALADWHPFQSRVLAITRAAHRFTVLLPLREGEDAGSDRSRARIELARRIVSRESPAHCVFDVAFHSELFRIGQVRLGEPAVLGFGARDPQRRPPARLGFTTLAASLLTSRLDPLAAQRFVVGRDAPASSSAR